MSFVLVHGAWGGSYGFRAVRALLRAQGHEVLTPSLTGIGERSHLTGPMVGLSTHILDVADNGAVRGPVRRRAVRLLHASAARARGSDAWRYHEIATTHMIPENRPDDLASLLAELAP
jgi:dienelactone hydrolase